MSNTQLTTLTSKLAAKFDLGDGSGLLDTLKKTAFKGAVSDEQMTALLIVANHIRISEAGCWEWTGAKTRGYGQLTYRGVHQTAHRFSFQHFVEPIREGMWVLHHCDNRSCVNPAHLYQGTAIDNRADMLRRKRWVHPWSRRTHCIKGHEYAVVGYRIDKNDGSRVCRECQRNYKRDQRTAKQRN